ncbi:7f9fd39d-903f-4af4-982e-28d601506844 [Thermothielavioides terrestris]|uniref:7f9fd39d-903f-4af4-982e-28d601506844 n=1 Tax=Thermothielavioides terrestris TaxID=2587410 RepID=A0A3S4C2C7_9PEZI|nr:7f9fd39d-903f-4af4-982e-28d601506844 [Thermothielavioides terrestris]
MLQDMDLGSGAQAVVFRAWDVSTAIEYAVKEPLKERFHERLRREIQLLRRINHDCVVRCIPELSMTEPVPRLVLEYIPLGSLEDQHEKNHISIHETFEVLRQGLSALRHLHEREIPIVHRDIKPSNILVQSRTPVLHIKLSDFGFSGENEDYLKTCCGTPVYTAPEVFRGEPYNAAVDIWSLGVVVFQYAYGLPKLNREVLFNGAQWTKDIVRTLEAGARDLYCPLLSFLGRAMLVEDRKSRYPAHQCARQVCHLDVSQFRCSSAYPDLYAQG